MPFRRRSRLLAELDPLDHEAQSAGAPPLSGETTGEGLYEYIEVDRGLFQHGRYFAGADRGGFFVQDPGIGPPRRHSRP